MLPLLVALLALPTAMGADASWSRVLWYLKPGTKFEEGLAIGNGRLGALVMGSAQERLIINENSVWSGDFQDRVNPNALEAFPQVREYLENGNISQAGADFLANMTGIPTTSRMFGVTNDLLIDFEHPQNKCMDYKRWLDPMTGVAGVAYNYEKVHYSRQYVADYQSQVLAIRLQSGKKGQLSANVSLSRDQGILGLDSETVTNTITMNVGGDDAGSVPFYSGVRVSTDGKTTSSGGALAVKGATTIDIFYDTETQFHWGSDEYKDKVISRLDDADSQGFAALKSQATNDHSSLMERVKIDLGPSDGAAKLPTNSRLNSYATEPDTDHGLLALMFQFGRHLLISSSRDFGAGGYGVPANLQGIWNKDYEPAWGCKYTVNINTEMNYWLAETSNLAETLPPLWDLMGRSRERGADVAKKMYGCPGFVSHHNLDIWGDSAPHDNGTQWTASALSSLWLASHMADHYRFTGDKAFLTDTAWPLFHQAAQFWNCYLFKFEGYWSSGPSASPENSFIIPEGMTNEGSEEGIDISPQFDTSLLYRFFSDLIELADVLNIDLSADDELSGAKDFLEGLRPTQIGQYGQVQEWRNDYEEVEPGHRHLSHLWDLFPGSRMSPLINETLSVAAQKSIERRLSSGGAATGWSRIWTAACYARLFNGDSAYDQIQTLVQNHTMLNGFNGIDGKETFQIDSNFGLVAAVSETLLQSHAGVIHLLPALSSKFDKGSVKGLVARGGFVVSIAWKHGNLTEATIESKLGNDLKLRVGGGVSFMIDGKSMESAATKAGTAYRVTLSK